MRILFANHTSEWGGAENSMLRLAEGLAATEEVAVACPRNGPLPDEVRRRGLQHLAVPGTSASFRLDPVKTPAGFAELFVQGLALRRAASRFGADLVHANSPRAGLSAAVAAKLGSPTVVVRIHDNLPYSRLAHAVRRVVAGGATELIAISDRTAETFEHGLGERRALTVYPSIDHARFDPAILDGEAVRLELGLGPEARLIGMVAQITPWKRHEIAIHVLAALRRAGIDAHLALVGTVSFKSARYDNDRYLTKLHELTRTLQVAEFVHFLGQRGDVAAVLKAMDLSLLPSRNEAFGAVVPESMAVGTPAIAAASSGAAEIVADGETGRLVSGHDPDDWSRAALELLRDPARLAAMGAAGPAAVAWLTDDWHLQEIARIHTRALDRAGRADQVGNRPTSGVSGSG